MDEQSRQFDDALSRGDTFVRRMMASEKRIYAFILTLVPNLSDAEDILQDTASLMWVKYNENPDIEKFTSWGIRIAHYKVLEFRKKRYRSKIKFTDEVLDEVLGGAVSVNDNLEERFEALQSCLKKLNDRDRKLILLKHENHVPTDKIAEQLHMSVASVYKAVPKVRDMLVRCVMRSLHEIGVQ